MDEEETQPRSIHSEQEGDIVPEVFVGDAEAPPSFDLPLPVEEDSPPPPTLPVVSVSPPLTPTHNPALQASAVPSPLPRSPAPVTPPHVASPVKTSKPNSKVPSIAENLTDAVSKLLPQGQELSDHVEELTETVRRLSKNMDSPQNPGVDSNIEKIAQMSQVLTNEANALRTSIRSLSHDIERTKMELYAAKGEDVNFPYHLFLVEMIVNKIHMKCECFQLDSNNLVISATFLGKPPIILYDSSYGKVENFGKLNVGKSTLFAMTYDKICAINKFEIQLRLTKEPPCTNCVTKIADTVMDYTQEFTNLREELCKKWNEEKPNDNIICTTSTPLSKSMFYLTCGENSPDSIGIIEVSVRMSFLGKEITTAFTASPKPIGTNMLSKEDNGVKMYSSQKVEMDEQGKILLDEDAMSKRELPCGSLPYEPYECPSQYSNRALARRSDHRSRGYGQHSQHRFQGGGNVPKYDEIFTKMNTNELKIRVPKSTRVERMGKYADIQEMCICEDTPHNTGEQIQFELPKDLCKPDKTHNTYTQNLKYTFTGCDKSCESKDRKIVNVTPTNCPVSAVNMQKVLHPNKDVFILKIGKKLETKDRKTDLEIELVTPKVNSDKGADVGVQNSSDTLHSKKGKKKGKGKGKGKKVKGKKSKTSMKGKKKSKTSIKGKADILTANTQGSEREMLPSSRNHAKGKNESKDTNGNNTNTNGKTANWTTNNHRGENALESPDVRMKSRKYGTSDRDHNPGNHDKTGIRGKMGTEGSRRSNKDHRGTNTERRGGTQGNRGVANGTRGVGQGVKAGAQSKTRSHGKDIRSNNIKGNRGRKVNGSSNKGRTGKLTASAKGSGVSVVLEPSHTRSCSWGSPVSSYCRPVECVEIREPCN